MVNLRGVGLDIAQALDQARAWVADAYTDRVRLERATGQFETDDLGARHPILATVYGDGDGAPGLVLYKPATRKVIGQAAGQDIDVADYVVKLPFDAEPQADDICTVLNSLDPGHVGRRWRLLVVPSDGWLVQRRCPADPMW